MRVLVSSGSKKVPLSSPVTRSRMLISYAVGHVLTRIVCKGADALASLHRYDEEVTLLRELLGQRRWRKGKRGYAHHLTKILPNIRPRVLHLIFIHAL